MELENQQQQPEPPEPQNDENLLTISSDDATLKEISPTKKKRKRDTPEKALNESQEDDGATCAICFDQFQAAGEHRIASLKCGHIFGESCIKRWLRDAPAPKSCPQCKTKAAQRDIRYIYATKIRVVDNSKEMDLQMQLKQTQEQLNRLTQDHSCASVTIAVQKKEISRLKEELEQLRNSAHLTTERATAGVRSIKTCRMYIDKTLDFKEDLASKFMVFLNRSKKLVVAQKSVTAALFPGYGVKLIDFSTLRTEKFINASNKQLTDFSIDSSESYVVTTSREATCKMFHLAAVVGPISFAPPAAVPLWSCSFDSERPFNLYLGAQNGATYIFDTRKNNEVVKEISEPLNPSPVKNIVPIKKNESFPFGGFFVVHIRGIFFYEFLASGEIASTTLNINEPVAMISYDERTEMLLVTKSPTVEGCKQTRHALMKLVKEDGIPILQEIFSFNGTSAALPQQSRPAQIKVPDGLIVASYLQDTKVIQGRAPTGTLLCEVPISDHITDICPIYIDNVCWFGALSNSRCRILKLNLGY